MGGPLADTERFSIEREHEIVRLEGNGAWTDDHGHALVGLDMRESGRYISEHGGIDLPVDDIVNLLLDGVIERVRRHIPWRPGARELLAELGGLGVPCALVTMSWQRFAEAVVEALPPGSFATVVAGDDVERGKPFPDPYLLAAEQLAVDPSHCIAIEDSPTGVRSALAAGCGTIGVPNHVALPAALGHHHLATLDGVTAADLAEILARARMFDRA